MTERDAEKSNQPLYWLPEWWGWMQDWSKCITCLEYNHSPCLSCEIPPGMLGLACLVGGGTAAGAGQLRGNVTIASHPQAEAAARVHDAGAVNRHLQRQQRQLNINANQSNITRNRR